jgi:hypothetical protein
MRNQLKYLIVISVLLLGIGVYFVNSYQFKTKTDDVFLENVDAVKAMEIANQWKWSKEEIKSYVTSRQVVFEFPNGVIKKIPLPKDKMLVAVAPYISQTHK